MYYEEFLPKIRSALAEAAQVVAAGKLSLPITRTYKPAEIIEAIKHYQRGRKVLLDFND
jgi:NADPH:quinone reductase-like Zn-dependent oxidoreductase